MNDIEKRKLHSILRRLDSIRDEINELLEDQLPSQERSPSPSQAATFIINSVNSLSAGELESRLENLGHKELGDVFVGVGGGGVDKRKPKAWLIERIIWLAKEFSESHKNIRGS